MLFRRQAVLILALAGCVTAPADENLPLVEIPGTVSTEDVFALFREACLEDFPDVDAMRASFNLASMRVTEADTGLDEPNWDLADKERGIEGFFGQTTIHDLGYFDYCELRAYVFDPDEIDREKMLASLTTGEWRLLAPREQKFRHVYRQVSNGSLVAELEVQWPEVSVRSSTDAGQRRERGMLELIVRAEAKE